MWDISGNSLSMMARIATETIVSVYHYQTTQKIKLNYAILSFTTTNTY